MKNCPISEMDIMAVISNRRLSACLTEIEAIKRSRNNVAVVNNVQEVIAKVETIIMFSELRIWK